MASEDISRGKLLKRAGAGAAVLWAAPVLTSGAQAGHGGRHTCGRGQQCAGDPCFNQTDCRPFDDGCSCIQSFSISPGPGGPPGGNFVPRCFCHQGSSCADLTVPCETNKDCKEIGSGNWACAASCCSYDVNDRFCHPPCGESAGGGDRALAGPTSIGYIAR